MIIADLEAVMRIKEAENWNQTEEDWIFLMNSNPEYCLVAVFKDIVVGSVTAINYQNKVAWIGMMLVSKEYRGIGISTILLKNIISKLKKCKSIKLDATSLGVPVYKKLGFIEEYKIDRLTCLVTNIIDHDTIANLDEVLFGVNRIELIRFLSNNQSKIAYQVKTNNQLKGYVLGRNGSEYFQVGPLWLNQCKWPSICLLLHLMK